MRGRISIIVVAAAVVLAACPEDYDFERRVPQRGTFGEEVHKIVHSEAQRSAELSEQKTALMERDREAFVGALDAIFTESLLPQLTDFLDKLSPIFDRGLIQSLTRRLSALLDLIAAEEALQKALSGERERTEGYHEGKGEAPGLLTRALDLPDAKAIALDFIGILLAHDGIDVARMTPTDEEVAASELFIRAFAEALGARESSDDPRRLEVKLTELALSSAPAFQMNNQAPLWAVALDSRGMPKVSRSPSGHLPIPFVDQDQDGLADADGTGSFRGADGDPLWISPFGNEGLSQIPRDEKGMALRSERGEPLYEVVDLSRTPLAWGLSQGQWLVSESVLFDLFDGFEGILPEPTPTRHKGLNTLVFPEDDPLMDLVHALLQALDFPELDELLLLGAEALQSHTQTLARGLGLLRDMDEVWDAHPEAELTQDHTFGHDLLEAAQPLLSDDALIQDLLVAMSSPRVRLAENSLVDLLDHASDGVDAEARAPYEACFEGCETLEVGSVERYECLRGCPREAILGHRIDRDASQEESGRSHFERLLALFRDTHGLVVELSVARVEVSGLGALLNLDLENLPPLLRIEDGGEAFLMSLLGELQLEDHITEEALDSPEVASLLDTMGLICGGDILQEVIAAFVVRLLDLDQEGLEGACDHFKEVAIRTGLGEREHLRQRISSLIVVMSVLAGVAIDETPTTAQLTRFFNLPQPSVDLGIINIELEEVVCADGYPIWDHHGGVLFTAEATGLLDALTPIVEVFHTHGKLSELVSLMTVPHLHYPTPDVVWLTQEGQPSERAGQGTGLVRFEPLLVQWLSEVKILGATGALLEDLEPLESHRGRSLHQLIASLASHLLAVDTGVRHRNGDSFSTRSDGRRIEPIARAHPLSESLEAIATRLRRRPEARRAADRAARQLADRYLGLDTDDQGRAVGFTEPGGPVLAALLLDKLGAHTREARESGALHQLISGDLYNASQELVTGPWLASGATLLGALLDGEQRRKNLQNTLTFMLDDLVAPSWLTVLHSLLVRLLDPWETPQVARLLSRVLDPDFTAEPLVEVPTASLGLTLAVNTIEADDNGLAVILARRALEEGETSARGNSPGAVMGGFIRDYHRPDPLSRAALSPEDVERISLSLRVWLDDEDHGMEQLYDLFELKR